MRIVLQRVKKASVTVNGEVVSSIGRGICLLVGIQQEDVSNDIDFLIKKVLSLRVFPDETGKMWTKSVKDLNLEILSVSQFTLYATLKGNKPDFHLAMKAEQSKQFYSQFLQDLKKSYQEDKIKDGVFGAMMDVEIINEGPVTLELDSRKFVYSQNSNPEEANE